MLYIGIDNGKKGAISVINNEEQVIRLIPIPLINNEYDIGTLVQVFKSILEIDNNVQVYLESSSPRPIQGVKQAFDMGMGYGIMKGILQSLNLSMEIFSPQAWQNVLLKNLNTGNTKTDSILYCKQKYPSQNFNIGRSKKEQDGLTDSLCIAIFGKRYRSNRNETNI